MFSFRLLAILPVVFSLAACKGQSASSSSASASASVARPSAESSRVQLRPVVATNVKVVRCDLPPVEPLPGTPEKWNNIAATRNLHLAGDGSLYFFPDYQPPVKLTPSNDGCGYQLVGKLPKKKDSEYGLAPDGNIVDEPFSDESDKSKCRVKALQKLRYGNGRMFGTRFIYTDQSSLMEMDLAKDDCEAKEMKLELPKELDGKPDIAVAGSDLVLGIGRSDWKYDKEIVKLDATGKLLGRVGTAEGKTKIDGAVYACGDGYCVTSGSSWLAIHDRTGAKLTTLKMHESANLEDPTIEGIADVPGKGLFMLVGYQPKKESGKAELVRLDGVF